MLSNLIGGLSVGSLYGLIAVGVALVYRSTGLVNFAQGELVAIGAYAYVFAAAWCGSPLVTMLAALLGGCAAEPPYLLSDYRHHQRGTVIVCYSDETTTPAQVKAMADAKAETDAEYGKIRNSLLLGV